MNRGRPRLRLAVRPRACFDMYVYYCTRESRTLTLLLMLCIAGLPHSDHASNISGTARMHGDADVTAILDSLSVGYDKRVRPNYGGPPVDVGVTMYVLSISSLSEVKMDFTLDFYFRQFWMDQRLAYVNRPGIETLSVGSEFIKNIWVPDTFFVNEKQSYSHFATTSNEFIRIHHSGSITRSIRLTITAACPMDLQYFPMDRQLCNIEIESFGYTMRDIRYKWNEGPNSVGVSSEVSLPQFKVLGHRQRAMEISLSTGNYSRLACEIQFVRSMGYYLIQIYIPSGLIVVISWVSFWLNRNATPARVSLGVTTVLTMTTLMSSTNAALPKISYVKSIDVYLGTCFLMVFASLLEYATVGYMAKRIQMRKQQKLEDEKKANIANVKMQPSTSEPLPLPSTSVLTRPVPSKRSPNHRYKTKRYPQSVIMESSIGGPFITVAARPGGRPSMVQLDPEAGTLHLMKAAKNTDKLLGTTPSDIDKYSRIVFPVCFICFNLMYWIIYLEIADVVADDLVLLRQN